MDGIDDLLDQVMKALEFKDPALRERLREGLEDGFSELEFARGLHFQFDFDGQGQAGNVPDVTVLDGGRDEDQAPAPGVPPDLEVVDSEALPSEPGVSIRVVKTRSTRPRRSGGGSIDVVGSQTIFRGAVPCCYRVFCESGQLQVVLDGVAAETLNPGQSIDVEASLVQVRGTAEGSYERIG